MKISSKDFSLKKMPDKCDGPWMGIKMISVFQVIDFITCPFGDENDLGGRLNLVR